jgi:hypothetical protein
MAFSVTGLPLEGEGWFVLGM